MHIVAATQPQGPMHLHSVADNLLEALAVVACAAPRLFHQLQAWLGSTEEAQGQLLDRWVAIASTRSVLECSSMKIIFMIPLHLHLPLPLPLHTHNHLGLV